MNDLNKLIPIKGFVSGAVVDWDNRYVKILKVKPSAFLMKKISSQNAISDYFSSFLKVAPQQTHFKVMTCQSDMSENVAILDKNISCIKNANRRQMAKEYRERLNNAQQNGLSHDFYLSFYQQGNDNAALANQPLYKLRRDSESVADALRRCENEIVVENEIKENQRNYQLIKFICNRDSQRNDEAQNNGSFLPALVDTTNPKYLKINRRYYRFLYIPQYGFPKETVAGWMDIFVNCFEGVDADLFITRENKEKAMQKIKYSISFEKSNANESKEMDESFDNAVSTINDGYYLKEGILAGEELFNIAVLVTVSDCDLENLDYKTAVLIDAAKMNGFTLRPCDFHHEEAFKYTLPTSFMQDNAFFKRMKRNALNGGAASLYPFIANQLQDDHGVYIADHRQNESPVILDLFNRKSRINPHVFLCGSSGSGKTVALSMLSSRMILADKNATVFILAPEKENELKRLTKQIGGQFIALGYGSDKRINILEMFKTDESSRTNKQLLDGENGSESLLLQKIGSVLEFLNLALGKMTLSQKQFLNDALMKTYNRFGITEDNESLWQKENVAYKKMPVMTDLIETLRMDEKTVSLADELAYFTGGAGSFFNGETNFDVENNFFVIGLEHNNENELPLALYLAMEYCWNKIRENKICRKMLICDEWWRFAFQPMAAEKSLKIAKTARAYNCSCVFATQSVDDIFALENGKYGKAVLNNCATKIILKSEEKDIQSLDAVIDLSDSEKQEISHFDAGEGYLISGEERLPIRFNPNETERLLMFSDEKTLNRYIEKKKEEQLIQETILDDEFLDTAHYIQQFHQPSAAL